MDLPDFLRFAPVSLRRTNNGWSPAQQRDFVVALARGASAKEAARSLGLSRQSAYQLRRKPDAPSFAAAWDKATEFARTASAGAIGSNIFNGPVEMLMVPRFYAGRLVGFVQRADHRGALRTLRQLDRMIVSRAVDQSA